MARKGNQQKNGLDRHSSHQKKGVSESGRALPNARGRGKALEPNAVAGQELSNGNHPSVPVTERVSKTDLIGEEKKDKLNSNKFPGRETQETDAMQGLEHPVPSSGNTGDCIGETCEMEDSGSREGNRPSFVKNHGPKCSERNLEYLLNGFYVKEVLKNLAISDTLVVRRLRASASSILKAAIDCVERRKPWFVALTNSILNARDSVQPKIEHVYQIGLRWLLHLGNIILLILMVWLGCTLRGIDSFLRMGTTSFFSVIWCSIFSVIAMIGMSKFLVVLVIATLLGLLVGLAIAILFVAISATVFLWFYGSFWTTALVIFLGGLVFILSYERLALFITTVYSIYCAWTYVGWLGLLLCLNFSFISSDALIFFLKNSFSEHRRPDNTSEAAGMGGHSGFVYSESAHVSSSEMGTGQSTDRSSGVPSTSGTDPEITSEDEVIRLLNCTDHYSALGLSRYENVDVSVLRREYRKKAMLVHPDKNMGNEKAAEAFKKLQNAYEVLLDSFKRKAYDDELRREELLNYFRRFQNASQKNGRHGIFGSGFAHKDGSGDILGESRRIACRKCGNFHVWFHTEKSKSQARWCQDCNELHPAKDGDGWVEQSSHPFFFGILQKVGTPSAYVCADSKIYDASEWYICQGLRCPVNTHKPSFHVNTSITSKHNSSKASSSGQRGGGMPSSNMEESMTEDELFEWLHNAVQTGMFNDLAGGASSESPSARAGNSSKSGGSGSKRKKKGKKQW